MAIEALLTDWGLPAVVLGAGLEGDGTAFLAGVMAHRGLFRFEVAALAVALGAFLGDEILYFAGRHSARFPWARRLLARGAVKRVQGLIHRRPVLLILGFRFLYGLRTLGALSLGAAGIPPRLFIPLNLLAVLVWAHLFVALGWGLSVTLHRLLGHLPFTPHLGLAVALALAVAAGAWILHHRRRKGAGRD